MKRVVNRSLVLPMFLVTGMAGLAAVRSDVADSIMRGDDAAARKLVDQKAEVNVAQADGAPAIHEALITAGADANEKLPLGRSPLMLASRTGNVAAMKALVDHGADVNAKEILRGTTPIMWAADEGHAPAIQFLIQHGANFKAQSDLVERGRGPALGKSNDPRQAVARQGAALAAGQA